MAEEILPEKWMKGVAITVTVLAVLTAIASSRTSFCIAQSQILTALEGSKWAYYQAKSIKQNLAEMQLAAFEVQNLGSTIPDQKELLEKDIKDYQLNIGRYDQEKKDIKKDAEDTASRNAKMGRQGGQFALSVVFFQIGIMLSSVSALLKRKEMWMVGIVIGIISIFFLANGFLLFL